MIFSCHNHSRWSDGANSIREMADAARAAGVTVFGISDHLVLSPYGNVDWSIPIDRFGEYCDEAFALKRDLSHDGFEMRVGVEADYFPETVDALHALTARYHLDYVIGAIHYANAFPIDNRADEWLALNENERHGIWELYIKRLHEIVKAGPWSWLAHIDLPKKFGFTLPPDLHDEMAQCIREIAASGIAIEVNTAGLDKPCKEFYPAPEWLTMAKSLGIPIVTSADAHEVSQIVRHFSEVTHEL